MSAQNPSGTTAGTSPMPATESLSTPARKRSGQVTTGVAVAIAVVLLAVGIGGGYFLGVYLTKTSTPTIDITETGSTLLEPLMDIWGPNYTSLVNSHVVLSPSGGGSGQGQSESEAGTIDIGASDAYTGSKLGVVDVPVAISSQLVVYNLASVPQLAHVHLNLNGTILAEIYEGTIKSWNATLIKNANPTVAKYLPNASIEPVVRSDSSGDTYIFSVYCDMSYAGWTYGNSTKAFSSTPPADGFDSGSGNKGVVDELVNVSYSIGYVGVSYLSDVNSSGKLGYAALGDNNANGAGGNVSASAANQKNYILWSLQNVSYDASLGLANLNYATDGLALSLILGGSPNGPSNPNNWTAGGGGKNNTTADPSPYPIVNLEYALIKTSPSDPSHQAYVVAFVEWAISAGNYGSNGTRSAYLADVNFVALTPQLEGYDLQALAKVTTSG